MSLHTKNKPSHATKQGNSQMSQIKQNTTFDNNQMHSINGTGEINYNQTNNSNQGQNYQGPQLTFDKNYLCMKVIIGEVAQDKVVVTNVGTTTVTYDWKKVTRQDHIQSKNSDGVQRFYCHYPRSILKPGESKTFIFSFRSESKPGMFFEEWELLSDPTLLQPLPLINLSGIAIQRDSKVQQRIDLIKEREDSIQGTIIKEILEQELLDKIESPDAPPPNLREPEVFKQYFEESNKHLGLYCTSAIMNQLFELLEEIQGRINDGQDYISQWRGKIEYVDDLIQQVPNRYSRQTLRERYVRLQANARKVPIDRAQSYQVFKKALTDLSENVVELEQKGRDELQMIENLGFVVPHEGQTEEEAKKLEDEKKFKKADWIKKTKRKPKTEEEENAETEELKAKIGTGLKNDFMAQRIEKAEQEIDYVKTKWLFDNHTKMDEAQYDELHRLESILDIDISGKDLIMRLDLDVPLSPYIPPAALSTNPTLDEHNKSQFNTKHKKTTQQQQQEALLQQQLHQSQQEEPWKKRDILDHTLIKKATNGIRYAIEHLANRTFIIGNLGEKCGKIKQENSMKVILNVLQQQLIEQNMIFIPDPIIQNFEHRKENEEFPETTTFLLENLNFKPDEFGYVEPEKPPEEPKPSEEDLKKEEELKQQQLAAQQKGAPGKQPPAKAPPVDKKKAEEEAKKKQEEEAAAKKKQEQQNAEKTMTEEERIEMQRIKEEAERKKREMEYFDYKTIHKYKEHLGKYGDIYVNDAPMMTLTNSNSIAEIKCKRRVMGVRMTEEIRKLSLFFLKKHPDELTSRWYTPPTRMPYHQYKLTAMVGGVLKNGMELLDKVLMINSLTDTAVNIQLYGEVGLAALYALGINVGRVERTHDNLRDYEKTKDFFKSIFKKVVFSEGKIKIDFPVDFLVSQKIEIEDAVSQHDEAGNMTHNSMTNQNTRNNNEQTSKSKVNITVDDEMTRKSGQVPQNFTQHHQQQQWKPYHWADKIINSNKHRYLNLERLVHAQWQEFANTLWVEFQEHNPTYDKYTFEGQQIRERLDPENYENMFDPIHEDEYVLEFGHLTRTQIQREIEASFKLFWDGSISPFKDAVLASESNKIVVQKLLDLRLRTATDEEPPITLLHGGETETVIRHSLMRLRVEQQEALEAAKRKAAMEGEEIDEEEDQITMTQDESKEEASTIQQDMAQISDFFCFDVPQFTMRILQGVPNKSLYNLDQHPKRTKEQEEEDLALLDEI